MSKTTAKATGLRLSLSDRLRDLTIYALDLAGEEVLLMVAAADSHRPIMVRREEGNRWVCHCFAARYSSGHRCPHLDAADEYDRTHNTEAA